MIDAAEQGADVGRAVDELRRREGDPVGQLRAFVDFDRRLFELGGDVLRLVAEARRQHPELGDAYEEGRTRGDTERRKVFATWPATIWREGVDMERAVAIYMLLVSVDAYDVATAERGWSPDELARWWHATLVELLMTTDR